MNEQGALGQWYSLTNTEVFAEKPVSLPLCPPQIAYGLAWDWTQTFAVTDQWPTTWAMMWLMVNCCLSHMTSNPPLQVVHWLFTNERCCNKILVEEQYEWAMPQFRWLVISLSLWRPRFNPMLVHVGFLVDKVALGHVFLEYFGFPVSIIAWTLNSQYNSTSSVQS
jgi:hypothetical protein